jgi:Family of unknown function (DUF5719)
MRGLAASRFALPGLVVLALAAVFAVAWVSRPAAGSPPGRSPRPQVVPLTSAIRSCPEPGAGRVAVFAAPGQQAGGHAGLVAAPIAAMSATGPAAAGTGTAAPAPPAPLLTVSQPGRLWLSRNGFAVVKPARKPRHAVRAQPSAVIISASGPMAQGLDAEQTSYPPNGSAAAVTGVQCAQPGTDFWFLGPGPVKAAAINLHLVNPDSQPAAVDVEIFTDTGPLQGNADTGIEVPATGSVVQPVSRLVPDARVVALHVRTSVGRVVAAVQTAAVWWRASSAPATQVVVPGLPGTGRGRKLYLIDPGGSDAQVHVQAITPAGTYEPAGAGGIDVPAGSVVALDLPSLNGIPAALRLWSAIPVTAAVTAAGGAFTAAAGPLQQQGVIADNISGGGYTTSVVVSAPARAAQARITLAGAAGPLGTGQLVTVAAGHSVSVNVAAPRGVHGAFAIVITPVAGSGPVYAGRVLTARTGGAMLLTPVVSAPSSVTLPPISGSVTAAIP